MSESEVGVLRPLGKGDGITCSELRSVVEGISWFSDR